MKLYLVEVDRILEAIFGDITLLSTPTLDYLIYFSLSFLWLYLLYQLAPKILDVSIKVFQSKLAMTSLTKSEQSLMNLLDSPPSTTKLAKYSRYTYRKYMSVKSRGKQLGSEQRNVIL